MKSTTFRKTALMTSTLALTAGLALSAGSAMASLPTLISPLGISSSAGTTDQHMAVASFPQNSSGQTYGSALLANSPENEPDLILVVSDNGRTGYVLKNALDAANGTEAAQSFTSPEQAIAWQTSQALQDRIVTVYSSDGKTQIGSFTVSGSLSQQ
jgi:hypothetical protein